MRSFSSSVRRVTLTRKDERGLLRGVVELFEVAMKARFLFGALLTLCALNSALGGDQRVLIDLTAQRAFILEHERVKLCAPIASGKDGWRTPTGHFHIISKDLDHRSGSFGLIVDNFGRIMDASATPATRLPAGGHYEPAPMPYFMEFAPMVGLHAGHLPGYPASHGCVRMPVDLAEKFFSLVSVGTPVTVVGSSSQASRVRFALPVNGVPGEPVTVVPRRILHRSETAWSGLRTASR
jgi:hypothetical protein